MSTNLSQTTSQRQVLQQRLILTQELQLFLKLIQMTTLELKDYLEEQLIENPTLEENEEPAEKTESDSGEEEFDLGSLGSDRVLGGGDDDMPHYSSRELDANGDDEQPWESRVASADSLNDHLRWQLEVSDLLPEQKQIASVIIGNTNEDGYLEIDIDEILELYLQEHGTDSQAANGNGTDLPDLGELRREIEEVLSLVQTSFDPTAACSRSLKECLRIQALDLGYKEDGLEIRIIDGYLEELEDTDIQKMAAGLGCTPGEVKEALSVISSLEPRPGRSLLPEGHREVHRPRFLRVQDRERASGPAQQGLPEG